MYFVALCYDYGMGTLPDKEKASLWYHNSNHESNDMSRALWYKVAAEHGSSRAKEVYDEKYNKIIDKDKLNQKKLYDVVDNIFGAKTLRICITR